MRSPPNFYHCHCRSPPVVKGYSPSPVKFDATTTTAEHFPGHTISPRSRPVAKPYNVVPVKFEATTTTAEHFPAHHVESPKRLVAKSYSPSSAKFDATTTTAEHYPGHDARKRAPVGIAVANDEFLTMLHGGVEVPTQAAKVFTTTVDGQASIAVKILKGWSRRASENQMVGLLELGGLPPAPAGSRQISITMKLNEDGKIKVEARDVDSGIREGVEV